MNIRLRKIYSNLALLLTALIMGLSFVAQRFGTEFTGPFTFNTCRAFLGALILLPIIFVLKLRVLKNDMRTAEEKIKQHKILYKGGFVCGLILFCALTINQFCMIFSPAGKAGFITSLYIIFVPLISVFLKKRLRINVKISVFLALVGLYFLCGIGGGAINAVDVFLLISAIFFAFHILAVNYYTHKASSLKLAFFQFLTVGILSLPFMVFYEKPILAELINGIAPILFSGIVVTGVAYTLQIFGQKNTPPVAASLILSMEAVFAVLGGMLFLSETLTYREITGCIFMICAIILSQLRFPKPKNLNKFPN